MIFLPHLFDHISELLVAVIHLKVCLIYRSHFWGRSIDAIFVNLYGQAI